MVILCVICSKFKKPFPKGAARTNIVCCLSFPEDVSSFRESPPGAHVLVGYRAARAHRAQNPLFPRIVELWVMQINDEKLLFLFKLIKSSQSVTVK